MPSSEQQQAHTTHLIFHQDFITSPIPVFPSNLCKSILTITPDRFSLSTSTVVTLAWNIHDSLTTVDDTIGIFLPDKLSIDDLIENVYVNTNSLKIGQYHWHCTQTAINKLVDSDSILFQYYNPINGEIRAHSSSIKLIHENHHIPNMDSITRPMTIKIYDLHATDLQRGVFFKPDPYMKVSVVAGRTHKQRRTSSHFYNQEKRTNVIPNTCHPKWYNQSFTFQAYHTDLIEFEVKDKFVKTRPTMNRFLGKVTIQIALLLDKLSKNTSTFVFNLQRRNYSDHVSGRLMFNAAFVRAEPLPDASEGIGNVVDVTKRLAQPAQDVIEITGNQNDNNIDHTNDSNTDAEAILSDDVVEYRSSISNDQSLDSSTLTVPPIDQTLSPSTTDSTIGNGSLNDANQMLLNISCNQPTITSIVSTHCSLTSANQGHDNDNEQAQEQVNEDNIDDDNRQEVQGENEREKDASLSPNHIDVESNTVASSTLLRTKKLKHRHSSSIVLPSRLPRSSSSLVRVKPMAAMIRHRHQSSHPHHDAYRTLQLPVNSSNKLLMVTPSGHHRPSLPTTAGSENNLQTTGFRIHSGNYQQQKNSVNNCFDEETVRTLSRELRQAARDLHRLQSNYASIHSSNSDATQSPSCESAEQTRKLITRELQEWHKQQMSKYKNLTTLTNSSIVQSENNNCEPDKKLSIISKPEEQKESMVASALPSTEDSQPLSSSSFIITEEPIRHPTKMIKSLSISESNETKNNQNNSRIHESTFMMTLPRQPVTVDTRTSPIVIENDDPPSPPIINASPPLPSGWESRIDQFGRPYFIDHNNKMTTWQRPTIVSHVLTTTDCGLAPTMVTKNHPIPIPSAPVNASPTIDRERMDKRYQSIRRTTVDRSAAIAAANVSSSNSSSIDKNPSANPDASSSSSSSSSSTTSTSQTIDDLIRTTPTLKFLCRSDFYQLLKVHREARQMTKSDSLASILQRIRHDPTLFKRYQHNKELVRFVNLFADSTRPLPARWDIKYDDSGKTFFVDHNTRSTTYIDPRLPMDNESQPLAAMALPASMISSRNDENVVPTTRSTKRTQPELVSLTYNEKVVAFMRQTNIFDLLKANQLVPLTSKLRDKIQLIRVEGVRALDNLSNSVDLNLLISVFHEDIVSYVPPISQPPTATVTTSQSVSSFLSTSTSSSSIPTPSAPQFVIDHEKSSSRRSSHQSSSTSSSRRPCFQQKLRAFYKKLDSKGYATGPSKTKVSVSRQNLLSDAFDKFLNQIPKKDLQKNKLFITFTGEEGLDYGGPSREFFLLMSRQFFNPYYGFFEYSASDQYTLQISPMSKFNENYTEWMRFGGRMLAVALINQYLVDAFLVRPLYKALLRENQTFTLADLEALDPEFYQSLLWIKENNVENQDLYFYVNEDHCGKIIEKELKPDGKNCQVTERNKREFLDLIIKWRIERGVREQIDSFVRGFYEIIGDHKLISSMFDARELELALCGTMEIDLHDWRSNTEYRGGYHSQHHVIEWFWFCVEKRFDNEQRLKLLQFVTGTSSIPYEGFSALRGSNGPRRFCIERWGTPESLPRAHTCFNRLDLPSYTSCDILYSKLLLAIEETNTFGIQ